MGNNQLQKAGDGSQQLQVGTLIINQGIEESRAREIFNEMFAIARKDLTTEAYDIATQRVSKFEDDLIPKMQKIDGALNAFADPAFQVLLTNAHRTAVATERPADYALLSELLIHRIQRGEDRHTITGISRAVEIIDKISDEALLGLSVAFAIENLIPESGSICKGIDTLNQLFGNLCYNTLPTGRNWLDHLDILDAVRVTHFGTLINIKDYYAKTMPGYCVLGIKAHSESHDTALKLLESVSLPSSILVRNELNPEYYRLPIVQENRIDTLMLTSVRNLGEMNATYKVELSLEQKKILHQLYSLYDKNSRSLNVIKDEFYRRLTQKENLNQIANWWKQIPMSFSITAVGRVLAYANIKRCEPSLPDLSL